MVQPCFWDNPPILATQTCQGPLTTNDSYSCMAGVAYTVNAAGGVLANDYNFNTGTALTAWLVGNPSNGTLQLNHDGGFTYTGAAAGTDTWKYNAFDGVDYSGTPGTVTMTVTSGVVHNVIAGLDNGYIAYSTDGGTSWSVSGVLVSGLCCTNLIVDDNGTVFAGLSDVWNNAQLAQIWKSTDHGATWTYVKSLTDAIDDDSDDLQIDGGVNMGGGKLMFSAGGWGSMTLLYSSTDHGVTWSLGASIGPSQDTGLIQINGSNRLFNVGMGSVLHNGASNSGMALSTDYGSTWKAVTPAGGVGDFFSSSALANGNILSLNSFELYQSADNGASWASINTSSAAKKIIATNGSNAIVNSGSLSVVKSTNGGTTFGSPVTVDAAQTLNKIGCLLYLHTGVLLAASTHAAETGTQLAKIYSSSDNGSTWGTGVSPDGTQKNIFCLIET